MAGPGAAAIHEKQQAFYRRTMLLLSHSLAASAQKPARVTGLLAFLRCQAFRAAIMPPYNDIIGRIDESRLLRWLVRKSQKAGFKEPDG